MTVDPINAIGPSSEDPEPAERRVGEAYLAWQRSLQALTKDASTLALWQEERYQFARGIGMALLAPSAQLAKMQGPVVYAIYTSAGLCYIGQTHEAERRLKDLPVGESHHLGNTLPPELWERVVVLRWPSLLPLVPSDERAVAAEMGNETCGLAVEHALQLATAPLLNRRRRHPNGGWTERRLEASRSRGALNAGSIPRLCEAALTTLEELAAAQVPAPEATLDTASGRIVLPHRISSPTS